MRRSDQWVPLLQTYPESRKLAQVSRGAECLYTRLLASTQDDAVARAHPGALLWSCFGPQAENGSVSVEDVAGWLEELHAAGLVGLYSADDDRLLALLGAVRYGKRGRYRASGLPTPPAEHESSDPLADAGGLFVANVAPGWRQGGADPEPRARAAPSTQQPNTQQPNTQQPNTQRRAGAREGGSAPAADAAPPSPRKSKKKPGLTTDEALAQAELEFPGLLGSPKFRELLRQHSDARRTEHDAPWTPRGLRTALSQLQATSGASEAESALERCLEGSGGKAWQGVRHGIQAVRREAQTSNGRPTPTRNHGMTSEELQAHNLRGFLEEMNR